VLNFRVFSFLILLTACGEPWVPTGGWQTPPGKAGCESRDVEKALVEKSYSPEERILYLKNFFKRCGSELSKGAPWLFEALGRTAKVIYDYNLHPNYKKIELLGLDGLKVRAELFIKDSEKPRPLIIIKCGLLCDSGDSTLKLTLMYLFDQGPFHVLLVPNISGTEYQYENRIVSLGGYDEGRQIIKLARYVQSSQFFAKDKISSVHVLGISLGGQAALYASLYSNYNVDPYGQPFVKSFFAACPVVDLKKSVDNLSSGGGVVSRIFRSLFWAQLELLGKIIPAVGEIVARRREENGIKSIPDMIARGALDYYKKVTPIAGWNLPPFENFVIKTENDFWSQNRFQDFKNIARSNVFVWAAENDPVVKTKHNAKLLENQSPFHVLITPYGYHCSFTEAYGWKVGSGVIRSFFMSESPELLSLIEKKSAPLVYTDIPRFTAPYSSDRKRRGIRFEAQALSPKIKIYQAFDWECDDSRRPARGGSQMCQGNSIGAVTYDLFNWDHGKIPKNEVEAQAFTRYLNTHVRFVGVDGENLKAREELIAIKWIEYQ